MHQRDNRNVRSEMHSRSLAGLYPGTLIVGQGISDTAVGQHGLLIIFATIPTIKDHVAASLLCLVARKWRNK